MTASPSSRTGFVVPLILMLAVQALTSAASQAIPVLAIDAAMDFGVREDRVGFFVSVSYFVSMIAALFGGTYAARYGAIRVSQVSLSLCALGLLIFAIGSAWVLLPAAFVLGLAYGPATPASSQILARVTPARLMNLVFSIKQTGVPLGGIIAGSIVAPLVVFAGWRWTAIALAGACLVLAAILQPAHMRFDTETATARPTLRHLFAPLKLLLGMKELRRLSLISIGFSAIQVCLSTYLVIFLIERTGAGLIVAGLVLTVTQLAGVGGRVLWGSVADWTQRPRLLLALLGFAMTLGAIAISFVDRSWPQEALIALLIAFGGTAIGWNGVFLAEVARIAGPDKAGQLTGATAVFTFAGPMLGPSLFSLILLLTSSYAAAFCTMGVFTAIGGLLLLRDARHEHASLRQTMDSAL
ncbi:MAG: transporter [Alphaproteobacteria bacterium]|nr:transporter [Alphaproteobacteria bacterium]